MTIQDGPESPTRYIATNGFSHIGITVPNHEELKQLKDAGLNFLKDRGEESVYGLPADTLLPLEEGFVNVIRDIAFGEVPDGY